MGTKYNPDAYEDREDPEYEPPEGMIEEDVLEDVYKSLSVVPEKKITRQEVLRNDLMGFLGAQMDDAMRKQNLINLVEKEIAQKVLLHEFDSVGIMALHHSLMESKTNEIRAITELFKPSQQSPNMILCAPVADSDSGVIDPVKADKLAKVLALLDKIEERNKKETTEE